MPVPERINPFLGPRAFLIAPRGDTRIDEGDIIVLFALSADIPEVERLLQVSIDFF